eukprot:TRINITY_DN39771_c0_g1_i1.p1 TRINITY_DN39771_c0_g1~~TRINITY_DN39771_c0_g1_i1.p1  ORF type:complete len:382 (-),score=53.28 TRINITY_DN39771_c0_g1_i1:343-1488(-)
MCPPPSKSPAKVQVLSNIKNSDLTAERNEYHFKTPVVSELLRPHLRDERDMPMVYLILNILEYTIPGVSLVYAVNLMDFSTRTCNLVGLVYMVLLYVLFLERFILCMHFSSHRSMWKYEPLNGMLVWIFSPFFGVPAGVYKLHHVIMHHIENNHELDISSTERFQRDSIVDFGKYWFHFVAAIWFELPQYCVLSKRYAWMGRLVCGLCWYLGLIACMFRVSPLATLWVFIIPYVITMSAMAFGNFAQHMFVNPEERHSNYQLTYNCIDAPGNQTTFNDGYHIVHHANARLHWTEMPQYFYDNLDKHEKNAAMTFRGIHFFDVGVLVLTGQLRRLAEHYVHIGSEATAPSLDEIEAKMRSWLKPVTEEMKSQEKKAAAKKAE